MLNQGTVIQCAISTDAMDDLEGRRRVKPDQRVDQFMRLRDDARLRYPGVCLLTYSGQRLTEQKNQNRRCVLRWDVKCAGALKSQTNLTYGDKLFTNVIAALSKSHSVGIHVA